LRRPGLILLALTLALVGAPLPAQRLETETRASFLPKFARYVTWPAAAMPAAGQPFTLCVIGRDPFGTALDGAAASEAIEGHGVTVRRMATVTGADGCHLAFVQGAAPSETTRLLGALRAMPVLTITDSRAGRQRGMIHFSLVSGRVRFFIDQAAASERGLTISSRLLALAVGVRQQR
jgi:hypothetical protein